MAEASIPPGFDFTNPDLYARRVPAAELAELRRSAPLWWNPQPRGASGFDDDGYWVVTRHCDVVEISRSSELFGSWENTAIIRHAQQVTPESLGLQRLILLNIDPPGRQPGPAGDWPYLQRHRRDAGDQAGWRAGTASVGLAERHQAAAGQLPVAAGLPPAGECLLECGGQGHRAVG